MLTQMGLLQFGENYLKKIKRTANDLKVGVKLAASNMVTRLSGYVLCSNMDSRDGEN